jgi:hypothetical protein
MQATIGRAGNVRVANAVRFPDGTLRLQVEVTIEPGSRPSKYSKGVNTRCMTLVQENGAWRIAAIATSP